MTDNSIKIFAIYFCKVKMKTPTREVINNNRLAMHYNH